MQKYLRYLFIFCSIPMLLFSAVGDLPLVNSIVCEGISGLDFTRAGTNVRIALFTINSNAVNGFDVTFTFTHSGKFTDSDKEIPMTSLLLNRVGGTIGTGLTAPVNLNVLGGMVGNSFFWNPGASQTTETVNLAVELVASWNDPSASHKLAGNYTETIDAVISVGL